MRKVEVINHSKEWSKEFEKESLELNEIIGEDVIAIHHIGSTAIPSIKAKPVIDILMEINDINQMDLYNEKMIELGYTPFGEHGIEGRRFYAKGGDNRSHHLHVF